MPGVGAECVLSRETPHDRTFRASEENKNCPNFEIVENSEMPIRKWNE
jgi:hypothetical protein